MDGIGLDLFLEGGGVVLMISLLSSILIYLFFIFIFFHFYVNHLLITVGGGLPKYHIPFIYIHISGMRTRNGQKTWTFQSKG